MLVSATASDTRSDAQAARRAGILCKTRYVPEAPGWLPRGRESTTRIRAICGPTPGRRNGMPGEDAGASFLPARPEASVAPGISDRTGIGEDGSVTSAEPSPLTDPAYALLDAVTAMSSDLDLRSVLVRIVEAATALTAARYGALGVVGANGLLSEFVTTGVDQDTHRLIGDLPQGRGTLGLLVKEPRAIRMHDLAAHSQSVGFPA